ncbi:PQQ-binding-like beta-propeller repeat protein [Streptomyces sp. BR123]|uniref:outer membrane protein assembly factor BamB family protein n=1 Tax=Streptomyces sp. BR123 TaxID=2749828 RepID=UPI0015C4DB09|nr:PQQ-binding-like beta-propeller repeat protein [Streptomyces sp. BR123]NXY97010.1 PQQ-binding-like beta-propeller repeat protein [Streptomyces sp. BR123]
MNDRPPPLVKRLRDHAVLAAACAATAVTVLYAALLEKLARVDMAGSVCGPEDCPRGMGLLVLFMLVAGVAAGLLWVAARRGRPWRSGVGWAVAVVVALTALWPAWNGFSWMRGPHMDLFGYQVPEGAGAGKPLGSWTGQRYSGLVVRVREDAAIVYNGEGRRNGGHRAPEGTKVCGMSPDAPSGTGILAFATVTAAGVGPCGTRLAALDLSEGKQLWAKDVPDPAGTVAAGGPLAVSATAGAVLAHDLRDGTERWRAPLPRPGATVQEVAAGPDRVLVTLTSAEGGGELLALNAGTGAVAWQVPLPAGPERPRIVSAVPAAVVADNRLLLFDGTGRPRAAEGAQPPYVPSGDGQRRVFGDVLVVAVPEREKREVLEAYSLVDGRRLWRRAFDHDWAVRALGDAGWTDRIAVVTQGAFTHLWHLDPRTGTPSGESTVLRNLPMGDSIALHGRTFVNLDPGGRLPPIFDVAAAFGW